MLERTLKPLMLCLLASACAQSGTETDNPITDFRSSECKGGSSETALSVAALDSEPPSDGTTMAQIASPMAGPEYDGLFCVAWSASEDGALSIELYNLSGGCHVVWDGRVRDEAGGLALELQPHNCAIGGCGACTYDLGVDLEGIDTSAPLPLAVRELACSDSESREIATLELPLDERSEGVICRPEPRMYSGFRAHCGGAHLPVCDPEDDEVIVDCGDEGAPECAEGLSCEAGAPDVCLTACEGDDDCPLAIERCDGGVCRLRESL